MSDYAVRVEHVPAEPGDPIPWAYSVTVSGMVVWSGWAGTETEAHEYAQEWIDRDLAGTA